MNSVPDPAGLPAALAARPWDPRRGVPIPVTNEHQTDEGLVVDFTSINAQRAQHCAEQGLCGMCGTALDYWIAFLGGPSSAAHLTYPDPGTHLDCVLAAITWCPHLAIQRHRRVPDHRLRPDTVLPEDFTDDKPDQWVLGLTRSYRHGLVRGTLRFYPAPFKHVRRFAYTDGRLAEVTS
ncbi:hypothetical protein [Kutzneria buriramensis]|uniref:Uncharacterized protein n=1 Tax=Kutzneria buriramensis TaxID=1045776 RepID=A0A3E0GWL5_9PSEU|nr:hypothetical protein [Kutzneria buriramensis]REH31075.1 hypothetical protein BCF44_12298 [Kutzneria buriramensis]